MKLSTKGKYGLYAMYYLAQHTGDGPQPLKAVSAIGVSEDYLEQLLGNLRRAGLVPPYAEPRVVTCWERNPRRSPWGTSSTPRKAR